MIRIGSECARSLQRLYFDQKTLAEKLSEQTGVVYRDALGMDASIAIVQPCDEFGSDESVHDRARSAVEMMRERARRLETTIAAL